MLRLKRIGRLLAIRPAVIPNFDIRRGRRDLKTKNELTSSHPSQKLDMVFTEHLADVGNGQIEYLDTGASTNQENYNTFLFIPGAGHTARTQSLPNSLLTQIVTTESLIVSRLGLEQLPCLNGEWASLPNCLQMK